MNADPAVSFTDIDGMKRISTVLLHSSSERDTNKIGSLLGTIVLDLFKMGCPVNGIYLSGRINAGKSNFLAGVVQSFDGGKGFSVDRLRRPPVHKDAIQVYPKAVHRDILKDSIQNCLKRTLVGEDEVLLVEWADHLPVNWLEKDRIAVEMRRQRNKDRTIVISGNGNGLIAVQELTAAMQTNSTEEWNEVH